MEQMRLKKLLSSVGYCSRRQAEEYIRTGKILVNGKKATLADKVTEKDTIIIDGKKLKSRKPQPKKVLVFNKPAGVECTLSSEPWVKTLIDFDFGSDRVFPIGRLDKDSHGLLLLTNDGDLGNKLAPPSVERDEEYLLTVKKPLSAENITLFKKGVVGEKYSTPPQLVRKINDNVLSFTLYEGRHKHILKICAAAEVEIEDIERVRIGGIELGELEPGKWKLLLDSEFKALREGRLVRQPRRRIVKGSHTVKVVDENGEIQ